MNGTHGSKASLGALRGLLYMRIQELVTTSSLVRMGAILVATFLLFLLVGLDETEAAGRFQGLVAGIFALKFLPVFCLTKGGETLRSELKEGTIEYLWVRPASKVELYFGFILSGFLGIMSIIGPALLGISLSGLFMGVIGVSGLAMLWLTILAVVSSFTAISGAIGSFSSKFVVIGIFYYSFVELGLGAIPNGVQRLAVSFHARSLLSGLVKDGGTFSLEAFVWILGTGVLGLVVGASIFSQSRYMVGSEKDG